MVKIYKNGAAVQEIEIQANSELQKIIGILSALPTFNPPIARNHIVSTLESQFGRKISEKDAYNINTYTIQRTVYDLDDDEQVNIGDYVTTGYRLKQQAESYTLSYIQEFVKPEQLARSFLDKTFSKSLNSNSSSIPGRHWSNLFQKHSVVVTCEVDVTFDNQGHAIKYPNNNPKGKNVLCGVVGYDVSALRHTGAHFGDFLRFVKRIDGKSYFDENGNLTNEAYELYSDAMQYWEACPDYYRKYYLDVEILIYDVAIQYAHSCREWAEKGINLPQSILEGIGVFGEAFAPDYRYVVAIAFKKALHDIEKNIFNNELNAYGFHAYIIALDNIEYLDIVDDVFTNDGNQDLKNVKVHIRGQCLQLSHRSKEIFRKILSENRGYQVSLPILTVNCDTKEVSLALQQHGFNTGQKDARDLWEYGQFWEDESFSKAEEDTVRRTTAYLINHHQLNPKVTEYKNYKAINLSDLGVDLPKEYVSERVAYQHSLIDHLDEYRLVTAKKYKVDEYFMSFDKYKYLYGSDKTKTEYIADYLKTHPYPQKFLADLAQGTVELSRIFNYIPSSFCVDNIIRESEKIYGIAKEDYRRIGIDISTIDTMFYAENRQKIDNASLPGLESYIIGQINDIYNSIYSANGELDHRIVELIPPFMRSNTKIRDGFVQAVSTIYSMAISERLSSKHSTTQSNNELQQVPFAVNFAVAVLTPIDNLIKRTTYETLRNRIVDLIDLIEEMNIKLGWLKDDLNKFGPGSKTFDKLSNAQEVLDVLAKKNTMLIKQSFFLSDDYLDSQEKCVREIFKDIPPDAESSYQSQVKKVDSIDILKKKDDLLIDLQQRLKHVANLDELYYLFLIICHRESLLRLHRQNKFFKYGDTTSYIQAISVILEKGLDLIKKAQNFSDFNKMVRIAEEAIRCKCYTLEDILKFKSPARQVLLQEIERQKCLSELLNLFMQVKDPTNILRYHQRNLIHKYGDTDSYKEILVAFGKKASSLDANSSPCDLSPLVQEIERCFSSFLHHEQDELIRNLNSKKSLRL